MLTCTFEDGGQTTRLRHATVNALVINDGQILVVKRAPHLTCGNMYGLPGGYMNNDERIVSAAIRETLEETGYDTKNPQLFLINDIENRKKEERQNLDFAVILELGEKTGISDNESTDVNWFSIQELPLESQWAFDHYDIVQRYLEWLKNPSPLPITNFNYS